LRSSSSILRDTGIRSSPIVKREISMSDLYSRLKSGKFLIAGPCVIENEAMALHLAEKIDRMARDHGFIYVFKASFDKANRTSNASFRGPGLEKGLKILARVKQQVGVPITTDIHEAWQAEPVAEVADILQIPAFLCRQTDLLAAAARTKRVVNIKKAQFLDGHDMRYPAEKVRESGNDRIILTERGSMFGPGNLVVDFRQIVDMKEFGYPVVMDVTHSTQRPGSLGGSTGGNRKYAPHIAKLAKAVDVDGYFFEVHHDPDSALSDAPSQFPLDHFPDILKHIRPA
jgi:2-dehydro-3-deoxyphosphooctonate aldolase (KDO 8-P synthase)